MPARVGASHYRVPGRALDHQPSTPHDANPVPGGSVHAVRPPYGAHLTVRCILSSLKGTDKEHDDGLRRPAERVGKFLASWDRDVERMLELFTDDGVYENLPMDPAVGKPAIRKLVTQFLGAIEGQLHAEIHHQLVIGNVVMNERTDSFTLNGREMAVRVCGVFEIEDGKVKAWPDYPDPRVYDQTRA
jgi:limonene-1,2-epoxide hydrolase